MAVQIDSMPDVTMVQDVPTPNLVTVATLRTVTTRRRLDRFWQMIRDEAPTCFEAGTYSIDGEEELKLVVVHVMKPEAEASLTEDDTYVFPKYRFKAQEVPIGSDPTDLGPMGFATPYNYIPPKPKTAGDGFV